MKIGVSLWRMKSQLHIRNLLRVAELSLLANYSHNKLLQRTCKLATKLFVRCEKNDAYRINRRGSSLPSCISQSDTRLKALANIREAIEVYLESLAAHEEPAPPSISEEIIEITV